MMLANAGHTHRFSLCDWVSSLGPTSMTRAFSYLGAQDKSRRIRKEDADPFQVMTTRREALALYDVDAVALGAPVRRACQSMIFVFPAWQAWPAHQQAIPRTICADTATSFE